jgi:hypothetical protein
MGSSLPVTDSIKVTIILSNRQIVFLDKLVNEIRSKSGAIVRRTGIIRALVDALAEATPEVTNARSEEDLRYLLSEILQESSIRRLAGPEKAVLGNDLITT